MAVGKGVRLGKYFAMKREDSLEYTFKKLSTRFLSSKG